MQGKKHDQSVSVPDQSGRSEENNVAAQWRRVVRRRAFLHGVGVAGAALAGSRLAAQGNRGISDGDANILRFLATAELIESDLWSQYNELGGVNGGNNAYKAALSNLDSDMPQYIADNTDDELTHAAFINAYLVSKGRQPVDLSGFKKMQSASMATGASKVGRLTNLQDLNVDTSWWTRYRSEDNIDVNPGAMFAQAVNIKNQPAIPVSDADTPPNQAQPSDPTVLNKSQTRMQAIANAAAFHFAFIEQGGSSLYPTMALKVSDLEVLRIVLSIGGVEIDHFSLWHDKAGNIIGPLKDPETNTMFPDFSKAPFAPLSNPPADNDSLFQANLILPEPCAFLSAGLPPCSIIRPTSTKQSGAVATIMAFTSDNLFKDQGEDFFDAVMTLAQKADAATRQVSMGDQG